MSVETGRIVFTAVFLLLVFALWQRWEDRQRQLEAPPAAAAAGQSIPDTQASAVDDPDVPLPSVPLQAQTAQGDVPPAPDADAGGSPETLATISNSWVSLYVSSRGGDIVRAELRKHAASNEDSAPFRLLKSGSDGTFIAQSGLIGGDLPTHKSEFSAPDAGAAVATADKPASLTLVAETPSAKVSKIFTLEEDTYILRIDFDVTNSGPEALTVFAYHQFLHDGTEPESYSAFLPTYFGAATYTDKDRFVKVPFDDFGDGGHPAKSEDGWVGLIERYFLAAWLGAEGQREFFLRNTSSGYATGTIVPVGEIAPDESRSTSMPVFIGAQEQDSLHALSDSGVAPGIDLAVDYGFLTIIADPMFWLLARANDIFGNWGVAIILVTCLIKLLFYPLSAASYKSMARMRAVAPRLQRIKEKHGSDKQAMQRAMMELYREEKINPFGGCLPILLQIPFFMEHTKICTRIFLILMEHHKW